MTSLVMSSMTSPLLSKAIQAGALGSMIYNIPKSIHQFASGLCADPQVNISSLLSLDKYIINSRTIVLNMFNFLQKAQYYLECVIKLVYCIKLNVLFSYLGCKLYEHLWQIRFAT